MPRVSVQVCHGFGTRDPSCAFGSGTCPDDCPSEREEGVHFEFPRVTMGVLQAPGFFTATTLAVDWTGYQVTCGLLWYAWGLGTTAGGYEFLRPGGLPSLVGPSKAGGGEHDWFTALPGTSTTLSRALGTISNGQVLYLSVRIRARDGQQVRARRALLEGERGERGQFRSGCRAVTRDVTAVGGAVTGGWECGWGWGWGMGMPLG